MTASSEQVGRRDFLKTTALTAASSTLACAAAMQVHAGEDNTIKVALVGCGGRGTGAAANALSTSGPVQLYAMADVFAQRMENSYKNLVRQFQKKMDVPKDRQFLGMDAFKKAVDCLGPNDVVILGTPPAFRPIHLEYAVAKGRNVFMEKSFGVDAPGVRRVLRAGEAAAKKNLKIAGGLMWRHDKPRADVIQRIHDGAIGDVILLRTYRMHGAVGSAPKPANQTEMAYQIANYNNFTWLNGSFFLDWLIHNIDVCCWAKNALPVAAQGHGARFTRTEPGQMYDMFAVEYTFADGTKMLAQGRHINNCWGIFSDIAHGSKGSAVIMESLAAARPRIYRNHVQTKENETWRFTGPEGDPYQVEWELLMDAIRNNKPYNEAERCAKACLVTIMGRMAAESGQWVTYQQAMESNVELAPGLDKLGLDSPAPAMPDKDGRYPIPMPGQSKVF